MEHFPGEKTDGHLRAYVELRKKKPELFNDVVVMAAPSGFMTEVTQLWAIEDLHGVTGGFPVVHQRDMHAAALTPTARKAMQACHHIATWIAGKMTPALQLTDTDVAFVFKAFARQVKSDILVRQKHAAEAMEIKPVYSMGPEEIVELTAKAHAKLVKREAEKPIIIPGAARNGMLCYRPSLSQGKLVNPWEVSVLVRYLGGFINHMELTCNSLSLWLGVGKLSWLTLSLLSSS